MRRIGIHDLTRNAGAVVRRVATGEVVEITDRGRPVARMVPLRHAGSAEQLIAEGRMTRRARQSAESAPLPPVPGRPLLSEAVAALRADER
jgi:prevent-host-death family protein